MAKNIARGQNIIAKNIIPNLVGMTRSTAEELLTSLGFKYTETAVNTTDANQNEKVISQGVNPDNTELLGTSVPIQYNVFSFAPFGAFGFSPPVFNFSPPAPVFNFSPPAEFSFTPFGAFSFVTTPVFGFTPFGAFGFLFGVSTEDQPACIYEDSLIFTKVNDEIVPIKMINIDIDDIIYSISADNLDESDLNGKLYSWQTNYIENPRLVETRVKSIYQFKHTKLVYFNKDNNAKFSLEEPMLIKRNDSYEFITSGMIELGDTLLRYFPEEDKFHEVVVNDIDFEDGEFTTYNLITEPQNMLLVNGWVVHNK